MGIQTANYETLRIQSSLELGLTTRGEDRHLLQKHVIPKFKDTDIFVEVTVLEKKKPQSKMLQTIKREILFTKE